MKQAITPMKHETSSIDPIKQAITPIKAPKNQANGSVWLKMMGLCLWYTPQAHAPAGRLQHRRALSRGVLTRLQPRAPVPGGVAGEVAQGGILLGWPHETSD